MTPAIRKTIQAHTVGLSTAALHALARVLRCGEGPPQPIAYAIMVGDGLTPAEAEVQAMRVQYQADVTLRRSSDAPSSYMHISDWWAWHDLTPTPDVCRELAEAIDDELARREFAGPVKVRLN